MDQLLIQSKKQSGMHIFLLLTLITAAWLAVYNLIQPLAEWIAYYALNLTQGSHLGDTVAFFLYDVPKILLMRSGA